MATTALTEVETLTSFVTDNRDRIAASMPAGVSAELVTRSLLSTMRQNPAIASCTPKSLIHCLEQMIMTGLDVGKGMMAKAYIVPYGKDATFQIGYKGVKELVRRSGKGRLVMQEVRDGDEFEDNGEFELPAFKAAKDPKRHEKQLTWVFAAFVPNDGTDPIVKVWSRERCISHRDQYAKGYKGNKGDFWHESNPGFHVMCMKCPIMELAGRGDLPLSADHVQMLDALETMRAIKPIEQAALPAPDPGEVPLDYDPDETVVQLISSMAALCDTERKSDTVQQKLEKEHPDHKQMIFEAFEERRAVLRGESSNVPEPE